MAKSDTKNLNIFNQAIVALLISCNKDKKQSPNVDECSKLSIHEFCPKLILVIELMTKKIRLVYNTCDTS